MDIGRTWVGEDVRWKYRKCGTIFFVRAPGLIGRYLVLTPGVSAPTLLPPKADYVFQSDPLCSLLSFTALTAGRYNHRLTLLRYWMVTRIFPINIFLKDYTPRGSAWHKIFQDVTTLPIYSCFNCSTRCFIPDVIVKLVPTPHLDPCYDSLFFTFNRAVVRPSYVNPGTEMTDCLVGILWCTK